MSSTHLPLSVLLVEDSHTQAEQLRLILEKNGFQTVTATNGEEALKLLKSRRPTLLISDIIMPGMDGFTLCSSIRRDSTTANLPVMLLTSLSSTRDILSALQCEADTFLSKPYSEEELLTCIYRVLEATGHRRRSAGSGTIKIDGATFQIDTDRRRIIDLLVSCYDATVRKNRALIDSENLLKELNIKLEIALEEASEARRAAEELALYDVLTGLANRRLLEINSATVFARARRHNTPFYVALIDIDHFKQFNDNYGHDEGDRILRCVSGVLQQYVRETDLAVRFGGEEFLLLLNDLKLDDALFLAERLRSAFASETPVTVSIGIAEYRGQDSFDEVVKAADEALYSAKRKGRNKVEFLQPIECPDLPQPDEPLSLFHDGNAMIFEWREDLTTGNQLIDNQHKELFRRINHLLVACEEQRGKDEIGNVLQYLKKYVRTHFNDEEMLQLKCHYPFRKEHREEHDGFIRKLSKVEDDFSKEGATFLVIIEAGRLVLDWMQNHICQADKKMVEFIKDSSFTE